MRACMLPWGLQSALFWPGHPSCVHREEGRSVVPGLTSGSSAGIPAGLHTVGLTLLSTKSCLLFREHLQTHRSPLGEAPRESAEDRGPAEARAPEPAPAADTPLCLRASALPLATRPARVQQLPPQHGPYPSALRATPAQHAHQLRICPRPRAPGAQLAHALWPPASASLLTPGPRPSKEPRQAPGSGGWMQMLLPTPTQANGCAGPAK